MALEGPEPSDQLPYIDFPNAKIRYRKGGGVIEKSCFFSIFGLKTGFGAESGGKILV